MFCEISIFTNMSRIRRPMRCAHTAGLPRYRFAIRSAFAIVCHGQFAFHSRHDVVSKRSERVFGGDVQSARLCQIAASRRAYRESDSPPLKIEYRMRFIQTCCPFLERRQCKLFDVFFTLTETSLFYPALTCNFSMMLHGIISP